MSIDINKIVKDKSAVINTDDEGLVAYKKRKEKDRKLNELEKRVSLLEELLLK